MWQMKVKVSHWPVCCVVEFSPWLYHLTSVPLWVDFAPKMLCVRANHSRHNAGIYELCANCPFLHLSPSIQILPPLFIERRSNFNGRRSCWTLCDSRFNLAQIIRQDKVRESSLLSWSNYCGAWALFLFLSILKVKWITSAWKQQTVSHSES